MTDFTVQKGRTLTLDVDVLNIGDTEGTQTLTLTRGGTQEDSQDLTVAAESETATPLAFDSTGVSTGQYTLTVNSADDSDSVDIEVTPEAQSSFDVSVSSTNEPVTEGELLTVTAQVTNSGDEVDGQPLTLSIDNGVGDVDSTDPITLASGETTTATLEWGTQDGDGGATYTATVASLDDSATASVTVEQSQVNSTGLSQDWSISSGSAAITADSSHILALADNGDVQSYAPTDGSNNYTVSVVTGDNRGDILIAGESAYIGGNSSSSTPGDPAAARITVDTGTVDYNNTNTGNNGQILSVDVSGGYFITGGLGSTIAGRDPGTGSPQWSFNVGDNYVPDLVADGTTVYASSLDNLVVTTVQEDPQGGFDITETLRVDNHGADITSVAYESGNIYTAAGDGNVIAQDGSGNVIWTTAADGVAALEYNQGALYAFGGGTVTALDPDDGTELWSESVFGFRAKDMAVVGDDLYVAKDIDDVLKKYTIVF